MADNADKRSKLLRAWDAATGNNRLKARGLEKHGANPGKLVERYWALGTGVWIGTVVMGAAALPMLGAAGLVFVGATLADGVLVGQINSLIESKLYDKKKAQDNNQPPQNGGAAGPASPRPN